jgi:hypothetical protein
MPCLCVYVCVAQHAARFIFTKLVAHCMGACVHSTFGHDGSGHLPPPPNGFRRPDDTASVSTLDYGSVAATDSTAYDSSTTQIVILRNPDGTPITLSFLYIDTEEGVDVVRVHDGDSNNAAVLRTLSGQRSEAVSVTSSTGEVPESLQQVLVSLRGAVLQLSESVACLEVVSTCHLGSQARSPSALLPTKRCRALVSSPRSPRHVLLARTATLAIPSPLHAQRVPRGDSGERRAQRRSLLAWRVHPLCRTPVLRMLPAPAQTAPVGVTGVVSAQRCALVRNRGCHGLGSMPMAVARVCVCC